MSNSGDLKILFQQYLHAHFQDPLHVAMHYSVTERTAWNWWEGVTAPNPVAVNQTWSSDPVGAERHLKVIDGGRTAPRRRHLSRVLADVEKVAS